MWRLKFNILIEDRFNVNLRYFLTKKHISSYYVFE